MVAQPALIFPGKSVEYTGFSKITPTRRLTCPSSRGDRIPEVYSTYNPKEYSDNSARWAIDFVDNLLYLNWQDGKRIWTPHGLPWNNPSSNVTQRSRKSLSPQKKNPKKAAELLNKYTQECADTIMQTYVQLRTH